MDEAGLIAQETSNVTEEALRKTKEANEKSQKGLQATKT
jgi:hypothetical protein